MGGEETSEGEWREQTHRSAEAVKHAPTAAGGKKREICICNMEIDHFSTRICLTKPPVNRRSLIGSPRSRKQKMKERLREKCIARAREKRETLLRQRRKQIATQEPAGGIAEENVNIEKDAICILESECKSSRDFAEWERQGLALTEDDRHELMRSIEEVLQSELDMDEAEAIEQYQTIIEQENAELDDLTETLGLDNEAVICPVCKKNYLVRTPSAQMIVCVCGVRLDGGADGLGLEQLRFSLGQMFADHVDCSGEIVFEVDNRFGTSFLRARCGSCSLDRIVM